MEERPWWPKGIFQSHDDQSISTSWGTKPLHIPEVTLEWWENLENKWGDWPSVKQFEKMHEDRSGIWFDIGDYNALVVPIPTGNHVSRLSRNSAVKKALQPFLNRAVAGCSKDGDHVLVYRKIGESKLTGSKLAQIHLSLIDSGLSTPRDEYGWNDRLKLVEDRLKTQTLWRAPHSKNTIGLPRFCIKNQTPVPLSLSEYLLVDGDLNLAMVRQAIELEVFEEWADNMDDKFTGYDVVRTATGGIPHHQYDVQLMAKAESVAFDLDIPDVDSYLQSVDRFQAKLGTMRMMKMGKPLAFFGLLTTLWLHMANEITEPTIGYLTFAVIGIVSQIMYTKTEPDWRQAL